MGMRVIQGAEHKTPFGGQVRLIFTDIDGTFVDESKNISPAVKAAAQETVRRGLPLAFATGRMYAAIEPWVKQLGFTGLQVVSNGVEIIRPEDGSAVELLSLPPKTTSWLVDLGQREGYVPLVFAQNHVYATGHYEGEEILERNREFAVYKPAEELAAMTCEKIVFLAVGERVPHLERLAEAMPTLERPADVDFTAVFSERGILNIVHRQASKFNAIKAICERLACPLEQVMAIGDGDNDAEMLSGVGCGVAMGNATVKATRTANFQVDDNVHDGIVQALQFAWEHAGTCKN